MSGSVYRVLPPPAVAGRAHLSTDVVVYGATPGGITAAIEARRHGRSAIIVGGWREIQLGGMMSGGLGASDLRNKAALGGLGLEFYRKIWAYYGYEPYEFYNFEPKVALATFEAWCAEWGVRATWTKGIVAASKEGPWLRKIVTRDGITIAARQWIDASYEGDLLRVAGATLATGREGSAEFNEDLAGVQLTDIKHNFSGMFISPHRAAGQPASGLLPGINGAFDPVGTGHPIATQAYNFRVTMTKDARAGEALPTAAPADYSPARYELFLRYLKAVTDLGRKSSVSSLYTVGKLTDAKRDMNAKGPFSLDDFGLSWRYITPDYDERERVWKEHEAFIRGFFWTLWGHDDSRVAPGLREEMRQYRYPLDEYIRHHPDDLPHWPTNLYVREYARLRGPFILSERDALRADTDVLPYADRVVALGSYWLDSHGVQRVARQRDDGSWYTWIEGGLFLDAGGANRIVPIPFECLLPRRHELTNVSTTWSLSLTHVAMALVRMETTHMCIGHAAGLAAAMACEGAGDVALHDLDLADMRATLRSEGAAIDAP